MLKVIKRNGATEPFNTQKLGNSLVLASDGINQPLTKGDVDFLLARLGELLHERTEVKSRDIYVMLTGVLITEGFENVAHAFINDEKNAWKQRP